MGIQQKVVVVAVADFYDQKYTTPPSSKTRIF